MTLYHATSYDNLDSIIDNGIRKSAEGIVYLADSFENAAKFLWVRMIPDIIVFKVEVDEDKVEEQFDHNYNFFKCRAYGYKGDIGTSMIDFSNVMRYQR